ncbi:MAG: hypothetical protein VKK04_15940 [Synechococcales bacterium]|nr:hypothetical protein [Synechococcales bacterium]
MADLSGAWLGTYWQKGSPTRFEATLVQGGNTLSGRVLDDNTLGEAQINGEVIGRSVSFTKRYIASAPYVVQYSGTISEDGDFVSGKWSIDARNTGNWEARRSGDSLIAELKSQVEKTEKTPELVGAP